MTFSTSARSRSPSTPSSALSSSVTVTGAVALE
jgi:hypothetical protein